MKKTALTFVALAFGSCVAFAQTTPQTEDKPAVNTEESITTDKMSDTPADAEAEAETGLKALEVDDLPIAVQETLKGEEFKTYKVLAVAEVQGQEASAKKYYQAALAQNDATEASLIVLFDEKGKAVAQKETGANKQEE